MQQRQKLIQVLLSVGLLLAVTTAAVAWLEGPDVEYVDVPGPTVTATVKVTLPPKTLPPPPPKTVKVTVRVTDRASRSGSRSGVEVTLACIRKHESTNNYAAISDSGTYRGAYQMSVEFSPTWAQRAGFPEWAGKPADKWPPAVQDAVAADMGRSGWGHWSKWTSYHCPGF